MRGSAGSFGITTSIEVTTFPAPPSSTVFQYHWDMSIADASNGIAAFQSFVQTNIPVEFGAEINLGRGSVSGKVSFTITGGWYGAASGLNATIAPLLANLPSNPQTTLNVGTYINSVQVLAGSQSLNTATAPDVHDTFYAKSLMTPASSPMSSAAITGFMSYLANEGFASTTVCVIFAHRIMSNIHTFFSNGSVRSSCTEARIPRSTLLRRTPPPSFTGTQSLPSSFTPHLQTRSHPTRSLDSRSSMVCAHYLVQLLILILCCRHSEQYRLKQSCKLGLRVGFRNYV
jgi:hypothetical protein